MADATALQPGRHSNAKGDKMSCTSIAKCGAWAFGASLTAVIALGAFNAQAQEGFYFGPEGGWTGLQGTKTSVTGTNPVTGQSVTFPINQSFNSGWNVGARAGYQWGPWRFEGEYSHRQNGGNVTGPLGRLNGSFDTNSFMANGIYDFTLGWPVTPHIGMGIGVVEVNGSVNTPNFGNVQQEFRHAVRIPGDCGHSVHVHAEPRLRS